MAMGQNLRRSHFGVDEHPFATYFDVHQRYKGFDPQTYGCGSKIGLLFTFESYPDSLSSNMALDKGRFRKSIFLVAGSVYW